MYVPVEVGLPVPDGGVDENVCDGVMERDGLRVAVCSGVPDSVRDKRAVALTVGVGVPLWDRVGVSVRMPDRDAERLAETEGETVGTGVGVAVWVLRVIDPLPVKEGEGEGDGGL